jgi:excisionase family DNA binding protein
MLKDIDTNRDHLTTPEAAERSGLTRTYLALLLRRGTLEGFRHGRDWFVYTDSLEAFLATPRKSGPRGPRKPPSAETHTNGTDHQSQGE